jgi:hypothetical protein
MALIKEMQSCFGSIVDRFYVMVSTLKYKAETQIDLAKSWMRFTISRSPRSTKHDCQARRFDARL